MVGGLHAFGVYDSHAGILVPAYDFASKGMQMTTCLIDVKNSIHDGAKRMFSCSYLRIDDFFDNLPLLISKVGWQPVFIT